jgi:2'-5' RNA ligase
MSRVRKAYYIWGLLDSDSHDYLSKVQFLINEKLKGPNFSQHLTLSGPILTKPNAIERSLLKDLAKNIDKIELEIDGLNAENNFYRSLYINIKKNNEISLLKKNIEKIFRVDCKNFDPHISLYYGSKNKKQKDEALSSIEISIPKIYLTSLGITYVNELKDIWRIQSSF